MKGLTAKIHALEKGNKYPNHVDLFHRRDGTLVLDYVVNLDMLSDLGLSTECVSRLTVGEEVHLFVSEEPG